MKFSSKSILALIIGIGLISAAIAGTKDCIIEGPIMMAADTLLWIDGPKYLPEGAKMALLYGNPCKKGPYTIRLKLPSNYKIAPHFYPNLEQVTVISGSFNVAAGDKMDESKGTKLGPGGYIIFPAKLKHFAWADKETVIQVSGTGPAKLIYVDRDDDPRLQED